MEAKEIISTVHSGKYPNGLTYVFVLAKEKYSDSYKWTSGKVTGNTCQNDEHFEVITTSPLVEENKSMYHKEDIKDPDSVDVERVSELNN